MFSLSKAVCVGLPLVCALPFAWQAIPPPIKPAPQAPASAAAKPVEPTPAERVQGAWLLERFEHSDHFVSPSDVRGGAIFDKGYLMVSMHAREENSLPVGDRYLMLAQAGMYQYVWDSPTRITCSTMFGDSNFSGSFEYEAPNTPRQFEVEVGTNNLVLTRPDQSKLVFRRLPPVEELPEATRKAMEALRAGAGR